MTAFLALLLAMQAAVADEPGNWTCQESVPGQAGTLWVRRILDPGGKPLVEDMAWHGEGGLGTKMAWRLGGGDVRGPSEFSAFVTWSRMPRAPVVLTIAADGKVERRPLLSEADVRMFRREGLTPVQVWYSLDWPADGAVPDFYRVRRLSLTAVEAGGATIGSTTITLPDWDWLDRETASARARLGAEAAAFRTRCRQAEPPIDEPELPEG